MLLNYWHLDPSDYPTWYYFQDTTTDDAIHVIVVERDVQRAKQKMHMCLGDWPGLWFSFHVIYHLLYHVAGPHACEEQTADCSEDISARAFVGKFVCHNTSQRNEWTASDLNC